MATLIDSYSETNQDAVLTQSSANRQGVGQVFTGDGSTLDSAKFYLQIATGTPTGNITARLYASTGTKGSTAKPANASSPLAESDAVNATSIGASLALVTFTFSGVNRISLANGTDYVLVCWYPNGDGSNNLNIGYDSSSPTHSGNFAQTTNTGATWTAGATLDTVFYVYGVPSSSFVPKIIMF
jgi:hypothetical protein